MPNSNDGFIKTLGILASIATIIAMCIGAIALIPAFGQWSNSHELVSTSAIQSTPQPTSTNQEVIQQMTSTEIPLATPIPSPVITEQPQPTVLQNTPTPWLVEQKDTYSILVRNPLPDEDPTGGIKLNIIAGGQPIDIDMLLSIAIQDVTGGWVPNEEILGLNGGSFIGLSYTGLLNPGVYALTGRNSHNREQIIGAWGNYFMDNTVGSVKSDLHYLVFPVENNLTTEVTLFLGKLEVGVIAPNGQAAALASVDVRCQQKDVAGGIIKVRCGDPHDQTDAGGYARFLIVPGKYFIEAQKVADFDVSFENIEITSVDTPTKLTLTAR